MNYPYSTHLSPFRLGIAGLGTVGAAVTSQLQLQAELLAARAGRSIEIVAVSARNAKRDRGVDLSQTRFSNDALALSQDPEIDVVIELIGGAEGVAKKLVEASLKAGKHVVTANKALLAKHGAALAKLAEQHGVSLRFEAAVAGSVPVVAGLREGLAANRIETLAGILNGTCNFILTHMLQKNCSFAEMLAEAQALGYAEAEPSFDIDGIDTAHKLALLAGIAFGCTPPLEAIPICGVRDVQLADLRFAHELGYAVKLLGTASRADSGAKFSVRPCLVPHAHKLARVDGAENAVLIKGSASGEILFQGAGAGGAPTASAVISDIVHIARGAHMPAFGVPAASLASLAASSAEIAKAHYMRLEVADRAGALAEIMQLLGEHSISCNTLLQPPHEGQQAAQLVLTTHPAKEQQITQAVKRIEALAHITSPVRTLVIHQ